MTTICLLNYSSSYFAGNVTITVQREEYKCSNLFQRYEHKLNTPSTGKIYLYNGSYYFSSYLYNYATLDPGPEYKSSKLEKVYAYTNRFDSTNSFLVLVFCFTNGSSTVENKYYSYSALDPRKGATSMKINSLTKYTNDSDILCPLLQENDVLANVLTYDIMRTTTGAGAGGDGTTNTCTYNCNKITVTNDTNNNGNANGPKLGAGFKRYKHAPCNSGGGSNGNNNADKPACIIYRCQALVGGNGGTQAQPEKELENIQGQKYTCLKVYFGCKAKRPCTSTAGKGASACPVASGSAQTCPAPSTSGSEGTCPPASTCTQGTCQAPGQGTSTCAASPACTATPAAPTSAASPQDVPLLLELHRNGASAGAGNPDYYVHLRKPNNGQQPVNGEGQYYWVKLPCSSGGNCANGRNGTQCTLKNLLEDIGLSTTKNSGACHNNGFEKLKQLLQRVNGNGSDDANGGQNLCQLINKANGSKLGNLLKANVNGDSGSQNGQNTLITLLLRQIEFDITDSLVILLDKGNCKNGPNGGQGNYGEGDISTAVSNLEPSGKDKRINRLKVGKGTGGNGNGKITVKCVTCSTGGDQNGPCKCLPKCLKQYGYCLIQHDFGNAVNGKLGGGCSAGLRLLMPTKENNNSGGGGGGGGGQTPKYNELHLYPSATQTDPQYLQYLYYQNGSDGSAACTAAQTSQTCSSTQTGTSTCSKLYVVFYKGVGSNTGGTGDPRPLLLCYGGCWYRPKTKGEYFDTWVKVGLDSKGTTCDCSDGGAAPNCEKCEKLLCELTRVVGFLNQVNLWQRPNGTAGEGAQCPTAATSGQGTCSATAPGLGTTCQSVTTSGQTNGKCTYTVHRYNGSDVKVEVTCEAVPNTPSAESTVQGCTQPSTSSCYKKLTHTPAGMNGSTSDSNGVKGYRLGDIVYKSESCKIDYYNNGDGALTSTHKWQPLVSVTAYFYNEDGQYCDPLLVELVFKKNGEQNGVKEYYKLTKTGSGMTWTRDTACATTAMTSDPVKHLDDIRYCLKQVVKICLEKNKQGDSYELMGRNAKNGGPNGFTKINNGNEKQIRVEVCECPGCKTLSERGYKCFKHKLVDALNGHHHKVAGLVFTLPGNNGDTSSGGKVVEIPLYAANGQTDSQTSCPVGQPGLSGVPGTCPPGSKPGTKIDPLTYNKCMGDICVYFYAGTNGAVQPSGTDTVPLMLHFNGQFYKPESRDQYFDKWVCIKALAKVGACGCCATEPGQQGPECTGDCCTQIANQLDSVNECLNRIDLDKSRLANGLGGDSGAAYGLPTDKTSSTFKTERVTLTKQTPTGNDASKAYLKVVHRTSNGFRIGDIKYCGVDFIEGVTPTAEKGATCNGPGSTGVVATCTPGPPGNGQATTIKVANGAKPNGKHKSLVTEVKANTVVVYYSSNDTCMALPQLIVLLKTDAKVNSAPVTVSGNKYGYYILASPSTGGGGAGGSGYQYQWRTVNGEAKPPVTLDDTTDFSLLNSAVILVERRKGTCLGGSYNDREIKNAVTKASLTSPGHTEGQVNRLTGKTITVKDETEQTGGSGATHNCLKDYGFRVMTHNLTPFVKLTGFEEPLCKIVLITGLKFVIPDCETAGSYKQVNLCPNGGGTSCSTQERHYYINGDKKIHVLFYGSDPRPLILCYGSNVYTPKDKNGYNQQQWHKTTEVQKCVCNGQGTSGGPNDKLLKVLVTTVGFLNRVDLSQHPKGTGEAEQSTQCQPCEPGAADVATVTCEPGSSGSGATTCKYEVHKFNGKKILVGMACEPVSSTGSSCYSKFTHSPAGMGNGSTASNGSGYRLGNIVYCGNGREQGKIDYYGNGTNGLTSQNNKWKPLVKVASYYYNEDKGYCDPLLVVLEFKNGVPNGADSTNVKEYYKLKTRNTGSMTWEKDQEAKCVVDNAEELVKHLDSIRLCLKKVVRIHLEYNGTNGNNKYALMGRSGKDGGKNGFSPMNNGATSNGKIEVTVCEVVPCQPLSDRNYKCLKHKLVEALTNKQHQVAGVVFTLPGKNGVEGATNGVIEIPLIGAKGQKKAQPSCSTASAQGPALSQGTCLPGTKEPEKYTTLLYNKCMGDICVYFYGSGGGEKGDQTDTVPLMVKFNGQFYRPEDRENYFTKWSCVPELCSVSKECGCSATEPGKAGPGCKELADQLDKVNEALNRIDLDPEKAKQASSGGSGAGSGYGLPENNGTGKKLAESVGNVRVTLKQQQGPSSNPAYKRIVHRTQNGFRIGDITYCGYEIVACGITPKGQNGQACTNTCSSVGDSCPSAGSAHSNGQATTIKVANGAKSNGGHKDHKTLVNDVNANTVVVYYSKTDECYRLPQLIVVLKTDSPVKNSEPVKSSNGKYGYYILASPSTGVGAGVGAGGSGYEYKWRLVNGEEVKSGVTLDDNTDFDLLNAAVILLEWTSDKNGGRGGSYNESEIKKAVSKAGLTSPGKDGDVNRLKGKEITVTEEKCTNPGQETHTCPCPCCCKCLASTGFKVMTHNLDKLVNLDPPFKGTLCDVRLITGLKFLIPTRDSGQYRQVQLQANGNSRGAENGAGANKESIKYHKPENNKICVYFYGSDPRPLLVCYNGWAYRANSKDDYDQQKWASCTEFEKCQCTQPPPPAETCDKCPLLKALVGVSDFLNRVNIKQVPDSESISRRFCHHYRVHRFNGCRIWIRVTATRACGSFCYNRYTHTHAGITGNGSGFRLGTIHYNLITGKNGVANGSCIKLNSNGNGKCISASDVNNDKQPKTYKSASHVAVFYYKGDTKHEHPLLVALKKLGEGASTTQKHSPYYELKQKFKNGEEKKYNKKNSTGLDLSDTSAGGQLAQTLDNILFTISKKLQIVLSTRPVPTEYKAPADKNGLITDVFDTDTGDESSRKKAAKLLFTQQLEALEAMAKEADEAKKNATESNKPRYATRDALMHHVTGSTTYQANLCDNNGPSEPSTAPTTTQITVTQVTCHKLYSEAGYRCLKHDLVNANHIESVGGLVLCLFPGQTGGAQGVNGKCKPCNEQGSAQGTQTGLQLCDGQPTTAPKNGDKCTNGKNGQYQKVQLSYTTCKGDLYVFFYGEDPRPLMLCYNKNAYRPVCMADYCKQWVKVDGATENAVDIPFRSVEQVLKALYRVSVVLNPVYLCLGKDAYQKLDPKHGQANGKGKPNGPSPQAADNDYTYPIDTNPRPPVRVRVTATDLHCYRQYTHKTEHEGYRLGVVTYAHPPCPEGAPQPTQNGARCPSSSNGSSCPSSPAGPAPAAPTPTTPFCFNYASEKQLTTVSTYYYMYDWCHYWPLLVELGFKGRPSEWWRLCSGPDNGSGGNGLAGSAGNGGGSNGGGPKPSTPPKNGLKWVRITAGPSQKGLGQTGTGDSCPNGQAPATQPGGNGDCTDCSGATGDAQPAHNGTPSQTNNDDLEKRQQECARDAQFARNAARLQRIIDGTAPEVPTILTDQMTVEIDLRELVERRAYEIRKSLGIEYGSKDTSRLIMKTDSNCYEESIMAYLVGGGVLGAAGGGGWKFVTMVTGVAVAL